MKFYFLIESNLGGKWLLLSSMVLSLLIVCTFPAIAQESVFDEQEIVDKENESKHVLASESQALYTSVQKFRVTGRIVSADNGEPLIGTTIMVKNTTIGTTTNLDGEFTIMVPSPESILIISYIGYLTREIPVEGRDTIDIELYWDALSGGEVVVIGYGQERARDLSTAVSRVSLDDLERRPVSSIGETIQGRAAGVQVVQPSGKPGGAISIRVRGSTSVQAGNEPLYVVDGQPTTDINNLNPRDVESIQILKDASAAAIYGSRGANGVVLITTKRGSAGESRVTFSSSLGTSTLPFQLETLNTSQYRDLMEEIMGPGTVPASQNHYTNWMDETFGTGVYQDHQLSISGGVEQMKYYMSLAYHNDKGIVNPASNERFNFRINVDNQVLDWMSLTTNVAFTKRERRDAEDNASVGRGGIILSAINTPPFLEIRDPDNPERFRPNPYQPSWENPLAYMTRAGYDTGNRLMGNLSANISLSDDVLFRSSLGVDYNSWNWFQFIDPIQTIYGRQENGIGHDNENQNFNWLLENTVSYDTELDGHRFGAIAGMTMQHNFWELNYISARDFPQNDAVKTLNVANQILNAGTVQSEWALLSYLGRLSYSYQSKYILTTTMRYDGSSRLAEGNRWGLFPSVSAAWRVTGESFMDNVTYIDDLKIRAGWGKTGNQEGIGEYASYGLFNTNRQPTSNPLSGPSFSRSSFENIDLRWETTTQTNVGIDLLFWDGRLGVTADAYIKQTDDLLLNVVVPRVGSVDYITRNDGKMENRGLEFAIESQNIRGDLNWNTEFNISFNRNKVTELGLNTVYNFAEIYTNNEHVIRLEPGYSLGTFYGYISDGVDPETGMIIYRDLDNTGTITANDRTVIGNAQPDFVYGMTNSLSYRGFDLSLFLQGSYGNDIFNASRLDTEGMFDHKNQTTNVLDRWRQPGDITDIPRATSGDLANLRNSSRFIEDGSYLRIKTLTLSYNFNRSVLNTLNMRGLSVYATGHNLYTFTNYSGFDPEVNAYGTSNVALGVDYGTYPHSRTIIVGVNLEF